MRRLIYIISAERELSELLKIALSARNYRIELAFDGQQGLKLIEAAPPDSIILDLILPKINGYELINRLKASEKYKDIPIIVLTEITQNSSKSDEEWATSLGVEAFITKPFQPQEIVRRVDRITSGAKPDKKPA